MPDLIQETPIDLSILSDTELEQLARAAIRDRITKAGGGAEATRERMMWQSVQGDREALETLVWDYLAENPNAASQVLGATGQSISSAVQQAIQDQRISRQQERITQMPPEEAIFEPTPLRHRAPVPEPASAYPTGYRGATREDWMSATRGYMPGEPRLGEEFPTPSQAIPMPGPTTTGPSYRAGPPPRPAEEPEIPANPDPNVIRWQDLVGRIAQEEGVPLSIVLAVMDIESGGDPNARSAMNYDEDGRAIGRAQGLMQVMPFHFGPDVSEEEMKIPGVNIRKGVQILRDNQRTYGAWEKAVQAYFGFGTDVTGATTEDYYAKFKQAFQNYAHLDREGFPEFDVARVSPGDRTSDDLWNEISGIIANQKAEPLWTTDSTGVQIPTELGLHLSELRTQYYDQLKREEEEETGGLSRYEAGRLEHDAAQLAWQKKKFGITEARGAEEFGIQQEARRKDQQLAAVEAQNAMRRAAMQMFSQLAPYMASPGLEYLPGHQPGGFYDYVAKQTGGSFQRKPASEMTIPVDIGKYLQPSASNLASALSGTYKGG